MTRLAEISKGFWDQFDRLVSGTLSAEELKKLVVNPWLWELMLKTLRTHPRRNLVHGVFNKGAVVLKAFHARCIEMEIDYNRFSWKTGGRPPEFDPNDPEIVVVLEATLGSLRQTFDFAWEWIKDVHETQEREPELSSNPRFLESLRSIEFAPWTIAWRRIKLNANLGKNPIDCSEAEASPGCALLFVAAQHPEWIKQADGIGIRGPGLWLLGLAYDGGLKVPYLYKQYDTKLLELSVGRGFTAYQDIAAPTFVG